MYEQDINQFLNEIKGLVAESKLETAIQKLTNSLKHSPKLNETILQSSRLYTLKQDVQLGQITKDQQRVEKNSISMAVLNLADEILLETNTDNGLSIEFAQSLRTTRKINKRNNILKIVSVSFLCVIAILFAGNISFWDHSITDSFNETTTITFDDIIEQAPQPARNPWLSTEEKVLVQNRIKKAILFDRRKGKENEQLDIYPLRDVIITNYLFNDFGELQFNGVAKFAFLRMNFMKEAYELKGLADQQLLISRIEMKSNINDSLWAEVSVEGIDAGNRID